MGKKAIFLLAVTLVTIFSALYVVGGTQAYSRYQQANLADREYCGGQSPIHVCVRAPRAIYSAYYPAYVARQYPLFGVDYSADSPVTLVISVSIAKYSQIQTQTVTPGSRTQTTTFIPALLEGSLKGLTAEENTALHIDVRDTRGHLYYLNDIPLLLHSRWLMQWLPANRLEIAAWITPNDSAIATLVKQAVKYLPNQPPPFPAAMVGYRTASPRQVMDQVDAIYDALRTNYHMQYVQASVPYASNSDEVATQNIKLPEEVLQQRSGMCIELTTLLAAAVERIGLKAQIIIIPGHAFLGVALTEDGKQYGYWDAVDLNSNVAGDSANIAANALYEKHFSQKTILDTINISEARAARIGPMI